MSDTQDQHDEIHDRLTDQVLREILAGDTPPDMTDSIVAASQQIAVQPAKVAPKNRRRTWWIVLTTAASVAVIATFAKAPAYLRYSRSVASVKQLETGDQSAPLVSAWEHSPEPLFETAAEGEAAMQVERLAGKQISDKSVEANLSLARGSTPIVDAGHKNSQSGDEYGGYVGGTTDDRPTTELSTVQSDRFKRAMQLVESSATPFPEDPPITYPDAQTWKELGERRVEKYSRFDLAQPTPAPTPSDGAVYTPNLSIPPVVLSTTPDSSPTGNHWGVRGTSSGVATVQLGGTDISIVRGRAERELPVELRVQRQSAIRGEIQQLTEEVQTAAEKLGSAVGTDATISRLDKKIDKLSQLRQEYVRLETERNQIGQGQGPGNSGDQYRRIYENPFVVARGEDAVSTFSIDVDTASYTNVRQFLLGNGQLPPPDAVRIEELVNYFDYAYQPPTDETPFAASIEVAGCPWQPKHRLVRVGIKGREIDNDERPSSNLVFLVDVSGSMNQSNKLPLVIEGLKQLTRELTENDRVAIVVYTSAEGLALPSTPGSERETILDTLGQLKAGGSTAGGAGIQLAYNVAQEHFITGGTNRVILCTDGDFNVGVTSTADLERMAEEKAKSGVFLTVLGFGRGNLNDAMMEAISNKGNGNYHYVDNAMEARKVLVKQMAGTLVTIAKDVKIQIEFNPAKVAGYRLLGYENRILTTEDFNDDTKDAGEIGAGHTVTALYEVVPAGQNVDIVKADDLKYQQAASVTDDAASNELLTLKLRYKEPDADTSTPFEFAIHDEGKSFALASEDFKFAAAVTGFGLLLRDSKYKGNVTIDAILELATEGARRDEHGYREGFLNMVRRAKELGL